MKRTARSSSSLWKGLLAGCAAGLVASGAKLVAEKLIPPRTQRQTPPPELVVERAEAESGAHFSGSEKTAAMQGLHWGFGTVVGGVYGVVAEFQPRATAWRGGAFGLTLNRLTHETLLPRMGLVEPVRDQPAQERVSEWMTHLVYGLVAEGVRRYVRKRL